MIGALAAWAISLTPPEPDAAALDARIRQSAAEAQALRGPLDGAWVLSDAHDRPLYRLQITDPAGGAGPLEAAWRGIGAVAPLGEVTVITRRAGRLSLRFTAGGEPQAAVVRLTRQRADRWCGWITAIGRTEPVTLNRPR